MSTKAKLLLGLALLREFYNKVEYYKSVVERNIYVYREYERSSNDYNRIKAVEKEIRNLEGVYKQLSNTNIFLEYIILRLETLVTANNIAVSIAMLRDVVKILRSSTSKTIPILTTLVDKLDELTRILIIETQNRDQLKSAINSASPEARKIIDEAKKIAGV